MEALAQANADVPAADSVVGEADGTVDSALVEAGNTNTGTNNVAAAAAPNESTQEDAAVLSASDAIEITERDRLLAVANKDLDEDDPRLKFLIQAGENSLLLQSTRCALVPLAVIGGGVWTDAVLSIGATTEQPLTQGSVVFVGDNAFLVICFTKAYEWETTEGEGPPTLKETVLITGAATNPMQSSSRRTAKTDYNTMRKIEAKELTAAMFCGNNPHNTENSLQAYMKTQKFKKDMFPNISDPQLTLEKYRVAAGTDDKVVHKEIFVRLNIEALVSRVVNVLYQGRASSASSGAKQLKAILDQIVELYHTHVIREELVPEDIDLENIKTRMDLVPMELAVKLNLVSDYTLASPPSVHAAKAAARKEKAAQTASSSSSSSSKKRVKVEEPVNWAERAKELGYAEGTPYFKGAETLTKGGKRREKSGRQVGSKVVGGAVHNPCGSRPTANHARRVSDVTQDGDAEAAAALRKLDEEELEAMRELVADAEARATAAEHAAAQMGAAYGQFEQVAMSKDVVNRERMASANTVTTMLHAMVTNSGTDLPLMLPKDVSPLKRPKLNDDKDKGDASCA